MIPVGGFLDIDGAREFLGNRSRSWVRHHVVASGLPCRKLFDRLLFDPVELRAWVEKNATRPAALDVAGLVDDVLGTSSRPANRKRKAA